jgi:hypothetical protein
MRRWGLLSAIALAALVACAVPVVNAATGRGRVPRPLTHPSRSVVADSFVSLVPAVPARATPGWRRSHSRTGAG